MNGKKILTLLAIGLFISMLTTSCGSRDACPGVASAPTFEKAIG